MPKKSPCPKYSNQQIKTLIMTWIHDKEDRKMLYLHLVDGVVIEDIAAIMGKDRKTVWTHLRDGKKELFSHIPYNSDGE